MEQLTSEDVQKRVIGNPKPIFIFFYSNESESSLENLADAEKWVSEFPNVLFFKADITDSGDQLRKNYSVSEVPATLLIVSGNSTGLFSNANGFSEQDMVDIKQTIIDYAP